MGRAHSTSTLRRDLVLQSRVRFAPRVSGTVSLDLICGKLGVASDWRNLKARSVPLPRLRSVARPMYGSDHFNGLSWS